MIAEGAEAARVEEAIEKRKRKVEDDKKWEGKFCFYFNLEIHLNFTD